MLYSGPHCSICGLALSAVDAFEKKIISLYKYHRSREPEEQAIGLSRPSTDGGPPSWCPIDVSVHQSFHDNLAVVGPFRSKSVCGDFMTPKVEWASRGPWWFGTLEHAKASLIFGLRHHVASETRSYLGSKSEHSVLQVRGREAETLNLEDGTHHKRQRRGDLHWSDDYRGGSIVVHVPCWELLQGLVQWRNGAVGPTPAMTPQRFWLTECLAGVKHSMELQARVRRDPKQALHDPPLPTPLPWKDRYDKLYRCQRSRSIRDMGPQVTEAVNDSLDGSAIDLAIREEAWERMNAWTWQPPYLLEVSNGFTSSNDESPLPAPGCSSVGSLPSELWDVIYSELNLCDMLALAATSRAMGCHAARSRSLEQAAKRKIDETYPWLLPYTKREKDAWERSLLQAQLRHAQRTADSPFSWLAYLKNSLQSTTGFVRNRKRVWGMAQTIVHTSLLLKRKSGVVEVLRDGSKNIFLSDN